MLKIDIGADGETRRVTASGDIEEIAVNFSMAVGRVHGFIYKSGPDGPDAAAAFRWAMRSFMEEDSPTWDINSATEGVNAIAYVMDIPDKPKGDD